jgi:hypothetical protein
MVETYLLMIATAIGQNSGLLIVEKRRCDVLGLVVEKANNRYERETTY